MDITRPTWRMRLRCPCYCGGEGFLQFITCPSCGWTTVVCDEVGEVFRDPHKLDKDFVGTWWSETDVCPHCSNALLKDFRDATDIEIQALGFTATDYC
jgi:hypothetical protein